MGKLKGHIEQLKLKTNEERLREKVNIYSKGVGLRYQRGTVYLQKEKSPTSKNPQTEPKQEIIRREEASPTSVKSAFNYLDQSFEEFEE